MSADVELTRVIDSLCRKSAARISLPSLPKAFMTGKCDLSRIAPEAAWTIAILAASGAQQPKRRGAQQLRPNSAEHTHTHTHTQTGTQVHAC